MRSLATITFLLHLSTLLVKETMSDSSVNGTLSISNADSQLNGTLSDLNGNGTSSDSNGTFSATQVNGNMSDPQLNTTSSGPLCTAEGFFRHPDDCTKFYRCVDLFGHGFFQIYIFDCAEGTVFDETISVCNFPYASAPCNNDGTVLSDLNVPGSQLFVPPINGTHGNGTGTADSSVNGTNVNETDSNVNVTLSGSQVNTTSTASPQTQAPSSAITTTDTSPGTQTTEVQTITPQTTTAQQTTLTTVTPTQTTTVPTTLDPYPDLSNDTSYKDFNCTSPGFYAHSSDCQKFWLCKGAEDELSLKSELYKCPSEYLYHDAIRRCVRKEEVVCNKVPDAARILFEQEPIELNVEDLQGFFARYRFF